MQIIYSIFNVILDAGAVVMLPIIITIVGLIFGVKLAKAFRSGLTIGRDIMGTMSNTLVLAYVGSGLHVTLLFLTYYERLEDILNVELIAVEMLQALAGSLGILFTIPATTLAVATFRRLEQREKPAGQEVQE